MQKVKSYADDGYTQVVEVDLSKYFDTLNHELLMNLLRKQIQDPRVMGLIKKYLMSGVMENKIFCKTEEGSPQGGQRSPGKHLPERVRSGNGAQGGADSPLRGRHYGICQKQKGGRRPLGVKSEITGE